MDGEEIIPEKEQNIGGSSSTTSPERPFDIQEDQKQVEDEQRFDSESRSYQYEEELQGQASPAGCCDLTAGRSELVVPGPVLTKGNPPRHQISTPGKALNGYNRVVYANYRKLNEKFASLCERVYESLMDSAEKDSKFERRSVKKFYVFLTSMCGNMKLGTSEGNFCIPGDIATWQHMFTELSKNHFWDLLNYNLLRKIVDKYLKQVEGYSELKKDLESYDNEVQVFMQVTKLTEFLDIYWYEISSLKDNENFDVLKAKMDKNLEQMTLANYYENCGYILSEFRLQHNILRLIVTDTGCIIIFWQVPKCIVPYIKKICHKLKPDFGQAGIIELSINDYVLYQAKNILEIESDDTKPPVSDVMHSYDQLYDESINNPRKFWSAMAAKTLTWDEQFSEENVMRDSDFANGKIRWFDGTLNASVNCLDRHAQVTPNKTAIIWEKNNGTHEKISYQKLLEMTCQISHVLEKKAGVVKEDVVVIYMPSSPIAVAAMLACTRIGAIHCVIYAISQNPALAQKIHDTAAKCIITSNVAVIGTKKIALKENVDGALDIIAEKGQSDLRKRRRKAVRSMDVILSDDVASSPPTFERSHSVDDRLDAADDYGSSFKSRYTILVSNNCDDIMVTLKGDHEFHLEKEMENFPTTFDPVSVDAEDTLFIMYTSGTSSSKNLTGIKHSTAGYLLYVALTHKYVFDYKPGDVFGCVADIGWITGHSYVVYGPLCNGGTTVLFEGTVTHPTNARYWEAIHRHKISQFYATPFAITELMRSTGTESKEKYDLSSLKTLATVGEPLSNPLLEWYRLNFGKNSCKFIDTWWQTETGGIALVIEHELKDLPRGNFPSKPFFGIDPVIIDPKLEGEIKVDHMTEPGYLCLRKSWPGIGRGVTALSRPFPDTYFNYTGHGFFTHDLALRLDCGGYKITGRLNNAMRIQGVWVDVARVEDLMNQSDQRILRSSLVGIPDSFTGKKFEYDGACVFVEIKKDVDNKDIKKDLTSNIERICKNERIITSENIAAASRCSGRIPNFMVVILEKDWLLTPSGKVIHSLYQEFLNVVAKIWTHFHRLPFDEFCANAGQTMLVQYTS